MGPTACVGPRSLLAPRHPLVFRRPCPKRSLREHPPADGLLHLAATGDVPALVPASRGVGFGSIASDPRRACTQLHHAHRIAARASAICTRASRDAELQIISQPLSSAAMVSGLGRTPARWNAVKAIPSCEGVKNSAAQNTRCFWEVSHRTPRLQGATRDCNKQLTSRFLDLVLQHLPRLGSWLPSEGHHGSDREEEGRCVHVGAPAIETRAFATPQQAFVDTPSPAAQPRA